MAAILRDSIAIVLLFMVVRTRTQAIPLAMITMRKFIDGFPFLFHPCIRLARGKFELTNRHSADGKNLSVLTSSYQVRKGTEIEPLFSLEMALNMHKKDLQFQKPYQIVKNESMKNFCYSKLLIWRQKWTAGVRHGTSLVVRRVSSGRPIVVLF